MKNKKISIILSSLILSLLFLIGCSPGGRSATLSPDVDIALVDKIITVNSIFGVWKSVKSDSNDCIQIIGSDLIYFQPFSEATHVFHIKDVENPSEGVLILTGDDEKFGKVSDDSETNQIRENLKIVITRSGDNIFVSNIEYKFVKSRVEDITLDDFQNK